MGTLNLIATPGYPMSGGIGVWNPAEYAARERVGTDMQHLSVLPVFTAASGGNGLKPPAATDIETPVVRSQRVHVSAQERSP